MKQPADRKSKRIDEIQRLDLARQKQIANQVQVINRLMSADGSTWDAEMMTAQAELGQAQADLEIANQRIRELEAALGQEHGT